MLIELQFLPSIEYFCALGLHEQVILEKHENFIKQSYRNRCHIMATQGRERISIPLTAKHGRVVIADVQIDYTYRWQKKLWKSLVSAYAKSPFFEHYADELHGELFSGDRFLFDFNRRLLSLCLKWLNWDIAISESVSYEKHSDKEIVDLRNVISAKKDYSHRTLYEPRSYQQVFGRKFVPNLSVIDLVCCMGPEAAGVIRLSRGNELNK